MPLPRFPHGIFLALFAPLAVLAQGTLTVQLADYAAVPQSGVLGASTDNGIYVARVNFLREEPGGGLNRFFVCDLNGKLYVLDKTTKQFAAYLDFQRNTAEVPGATGLFPAFTRAAGYANGLVTIYPVIQYPHSPSGRGSRNSASPACSPIRKSRSFRALSS